MRKSQLVGCARSPDCSAFSGHQILAASGRVRVAAPGLCGRQRHRQRFDVGGVAVGERRRVSGRRTVNRRVDSVDEFTQQGVFGFQRGDTVPLRGYIYGGGAACVGRVYMVFTGILRGGSDCGGAVHERHGSSGSKVFGTSALSSCAIF